VRDQAASAWVRRLEFLKFPNLLVVVCRGHGWKTSIKFADAYTVHKSCCSLLENNLRFYLCSPLHRERLGNYLDSVGLSSSIWGGGCGDLGFGLGHTY
jgi:hypothetical protein